MLPREVREALVAVVVDANTYGKDGPDLTGMYDLARDLGPLGIEVWVPEPVAWEMAEHAAREWTTAKNAVKNAQSALRKAGLKPVFDSVYTDRQEVIDACLARLSASALIDIVPLTGPSAIEGLKDQVFKRPPGKTKGDGVKTGGSDSAWLRTVLDKVDGQGHKLLFLSQDGDIAAAFAQWGQQPPLMCARDQVRNRLIPTEPASSEEIALITRHLAERVPENLLNPPTGSGPPLVEAGSNQLRAALDLPYDYDDGVARFYLDKLTAVAGIGRVLRLRPEPDEATGPEQARVSGAYTRTVTAHAFFLADAEVAHTIYDEAAVEPVTSIHPVAGNLLVSVPMVFEITGEVVVSARQDGDAFVFPPARFDDADDAFTHLVDALSSVPGLERVVEVDWQETCEHEVEFNVGLERTVVLARFEGDYGPGLEARVGDESSSAVCEYDETTWLGGAEGMHMEPPYYLVFADPEGRSGGGAWALSAWILAKCFSGSNGPGPGSAQV